MTNSMLLRGRNHIKTNWLQLILLVIILCSSSQGFSQVDKRFWFVVPELSHRGNTGGTPATLRIATMELAATVTISMPANPYDPISGLGFQDIVVNIPGNSSTGVDLSHLIDDAVNPTRNLLENKPLTPSGVNNFGLLVESDNFITAYWEVAYATAADLWVLKGSNGLGTEFYVPFQTNYNNRAYVPTAYSAIDIVSTANNNVVTITPPPLKFASYGSIPTTTNILNPTITVVLQKGQTFSVFPENTSTAAANRLAGTYIQSTDSIAVSIKDDALQDGAQGRDVVGDQLIPVRMLGSTYIVTVGENDDRIYVIPTQPNTTINAYRKDGSLESTVNIANAGQQVEIAHPSNNLQFLRLTSDDPSKTFYVFHMGREIGSWGGAILPAINECTGNTQVGFTVEYHGQVYAQVSYVILVKKGFLDAMGEDNRHRFLVDGVRDDNIIDPTSFVRIVGSGATPEEEWWGYWNPSTNANTLSQGQHLISNTGGVFHFGQRFGKPAGNGRIYYGYYSDYGNVNVGASTSGTTSTDVLVCHGYPVQLYAYGGTNYEWIPETYLDDPTSNMPVANNLPSDFHRYKVHISGDCADDTITINITVFPEIYPFFSIDKVSGCSVLSINVEDQSLGAVNYWRYRIYNWDRSITLYDQQTNLVAPPPFSWNFTNNSDSIEHYYVDLLVRNESGCSQYYTRTITVFPSISASFLPNIDQDGVCANPYTVQFENTSSTNTVNTYLWDFGDGDYHISTDPTELFTHTFYNTDPNPRVYDVEMVAESPYGCTDTANITVSVTSYFNPNFYIDKTSGCADDALLPDNLVVRTANESEGDLDIVNWSISPVVPFTFPAVSTYEDNPLPNITGAPIPYTIRLDVQNQEGCPDFIEKIVTVYPDAHAAFTPSDFDVCNGETIVFTNNTQPTLNAGFNYTYTWDYGVGGAGSTLTSPSYTYEHIFDTQQTYNVTLDVLNPWGCDDQVTEDITVYSRINAEFTILPSFGCSPLGVTVTDNSFGNVLNTYTWDYDGGVQDLVFPSVYNYTNNNTVVENHTISLQITNEGGCTDSDSETVTVYPKVNNSISQSDTRVCDSTIVDFSANIAPAVNIETNLWSFGDGNSAEGSPVSNLYRNTTGGDVVNTVTLVSTSDYGCTDVETTTVTVSPYTEALFTLSGNRICSGESITFNYLRLAGISSYSWNFIGYTDNVKPPDSPLGTFTKTFINETGASMNVTVRLTVDNGFNCPKVYEIPIVVYPAVTANIAADDTEDCDDIEIHFTNSSVLTGTATPPGTYFWDFGDGSNSFDFEPSHVFNNSDPVNSVTYSVIHKASNNFGCFDYDTVEITVYPRLSVGFSLENASDCSPFDVTFYPSCEGAVEYQWDFDLAAPPETFFNDNPFTRTFSNPNLYNPISYNVTLSVIDATGTCTRDFSRTVTVQPRVIANFDADTTVGCSDFSVVLENLSLGNELSFDWDFGDNQSHSNDLLSEYVTHTFTNRGSIDSVYYIVLTAKNAEGCTHTRELPITVHPKVEPSFTMTYDDECTPFDVTFVNSSLNGSNFTWDFDETGLLGASTPIEINDASFVREFDNPNANTTNVYRINLLANQYHAVSGITCYGDFSRDIPVLPRLVASFVPDEPIGCSDHQVVFTNTSTGGSPINFTWDFGNDEGTSTSSVDSSVTETYVYRGDPSIPIGFEDPTQYIVTLTATNSKGCIRSVNDTISVYPKVESNFTYTYDDYCTPFDVEFLNNSVNGKNFYWDYGYTLGGVAQSFSTQRPTLEHSYQFDNETDNDIMYYTITMVAQTQYSNHVCSDTSIRNITVYPRVIAQFSPDVQAGCNPLTVNFTNQSTGLGTYEWDLGDATGSTSPTTITKVYSHTDKTQSKFYQVTLQSTNINGCSDFDSETIEVYPLVKAGFNLTNTEGCTPLQLTALNTSPSVQYDYVWSFGDGRADEYTENPGTNGALTYLNDTQNPPILLQPELKLVTSYKGDATCIDSVSRILNVYPHIYPDFTTDFEGCHPHEITFTNLTDAYSTNTDYHWDFSNGTLSLEEEPSYRFTNSSFVENRIYTIRLDATSEHGCTDFIYHDVTVYPKPKSMLELVSESLSCPPFEAEVENNSLGTNLTNSYDYGDGATLQTTSMGNVTNTYYNTNSYVQPYTITLLVETEYGCQDVSSQTIYVFPDVTANFDFDPGDEACNPFLVKMVNSSVNSSSYIWDFDDNFFSNVTEPVHRFVNSSTTDRIFDVELIAYSEFDCSDTISKPLTVFAAPVAAFIADPPLQTYPNSTFGINNLSVPMSPDWVYTWQFGDGYGSSLQEPGSHTYETWGPVEDNFQYKISLRIDNVNCWDTISQYVTLLPREPIALYEAAEYEACSPLEVTFINNSQYGHTYIWDFGDGTTSDEWEPSHTFTEPGYYNVKLVVIGDGGEQHYYHTFRVYRNPFASFSALPENVLLPDALVHFFSESQFADTYLWDFGDGGSSTLQNPTHTYNELGEYNVRLTVWTNQGCWDDTLKIPGVWVTGRGKIKFPNAFVPNPGGPSGGYYDDVDYKNEVFHPYSEGVTEYKLYIFNRWGEQIFRSDDIKIGWDGYYKEKLCPQDVYVWRAIGSFANGKQFDLRGNVTLLR